MREFKCPASSIIKSVDLADLQRWVHNVRTQERKLTIEVGCGVGYHPIRWALSNPEGYILAFERTRDKFAKFLSRLNHHPQIKNMYAAHADAFSVLPHLNLIGAVDEVFILYPNPYPKARQKNLRFAHSPSVKLISQILKTQGKVTFATNIESYANELQTDLPLHHGFQLISRSQLSPNFSPRSHFEKKYLMRGETCWNLEFRA